MKTLVELVSAMERLSGREAILYHDGLRTRRWSYRELLQHAAGVSEELRSRGLGPGDRLLLWGENRPEWVAVFWAAVARRLTVVPVDFRSSPTFVSRVQKEVEAHLLVHGASVDVGALDLPRLDLESLSVLRSDLPLAPDAADPSDIVQVLYTSGTTGEPKGIIHRHRHLVPNLAPIQREIDKYSALARPFQPVRFLDLLPLSHVFGQFTGLFVPVMIRGSVAFLKSVHPGAIIDVIRRERISVLVSVPRFLESLRRELERRFDLRERRPTALKGLAGGLLRFLQHGDVHSAFGFKFWAILSGGARLSPSEEAFWRRLGFVVVQGYGLTETTSLVSTNHPFHPTLGSLGKVVGDQEIRLTPDGEILIRGGNVSFELFGKAGGTPPANGWLHTGDLGEIAPDGTLYYKGRKKDVIVGPEGLNVYPVDVESVLARNPAVKESVVIGRETGQGEVVHAVLLLRDPGAADVSSIVEWANQKLEHHQRIREWTIWPEEDFPRTPSTFKIRRSEVGRAVTARIESRPKGQPPAAGVTLVRSLVAERLGRRPEDLAPSLRLSEELGLSSIDRIELTAALEDRYAVELSEAAMAEARTIGELEASIAAAAETETEREPEPRGREGGSRPLSGIVRFARLPPARLARALFRETVILPLFRHYISFSVEGTLEGVAPPVIFAPNHTSNLDTIALVAALPRRWRNRLAPAVSQDYFLPYLEASGTFGRRLTLGVQFWLAALALNVFPLPQATRGVRDALEFAGRLVDHGYSILVFPEGRRTPDGAIHEFRPGVGLMAVRLHIPVIPVHIEGLFEVLSVHDSWPRPGPVRLRFGSPVTFHESDDFQVATEVIERRVRELGGGGVS